MTRSAKRFPPADRWVFYLAVATVATTLVSIAASQALLATTILIWLITRPRPVRLPGYLIPLVVFLGTTIAAVLASPDPGAGLGGLDKFVLFTMGPLAATTIDDRGRYRNLIRVLAATAVLGSMVAMVQFTDFYSGYLLTGELPADTENLARVTGLMSHWMTFSGQQMLIWGALLAAGGVLGRRWQLALLSILGITILITLTRSVWIGAFAAFLVSLPYVGSRNLLKVAIPVGLVALLISTLLIQRASTSFDFESFAPDRARMEMIRAGMRMIAAHPIVGVGPGRTEVEFPRYFGGEDLEIFDYYGHLHNNYLQIAAERGLLGLAALLWLLGRIGLDLFRFSRAAATSVKWASVSGLCVLTAFMVGGLFEYNFGDSEVFMLFIFLVSIPYGLHATSVPEDAPPELP